VRTISEDALADVLAVLPYAEPRVVCAGNAAVPRLLLQVLDRAVARYRLFTLNAPAGVPDRDGVVHETPFVGAGTRHSPRLRYLPARLSLVPSMFTRTCPPDVVLVQTSMPTGGTVSLGVEVNILPAAIEAVRARSGMVVAQLNRRMPFTHGDGVLRTDEIDLAVEAGEPLDGPTRRGGGDPGVSAAIGDRVAHLVADGATLQLGIGAVPDATLSALRGRTGLRVWSEMIGDGVVRLQRSGQLDPDRAMVASFLFGTAELYEWADHNPGLHVLRTERTNDPAVIARQPAMTAVNTALQVDLLAQANASRLPGRPGTAYSGFGGQTDFTVGALHAAGGKAVIALASWHPKADASTIVPLVDAVTSFQHSHIVTEHGTAAIWGSDSVEQARHLIGNAAHPHARASLADAAAQIGLTGV
jgi:acyl-CoA hydrolase